MGTEIRNQATLRYWITGNGSLAVRTIHEIHVYAKGKDLLNSLMYYSGAPRAREARAWAEPHC